MLIPDVTVELGRRTAWWTPRNDKIGRLIYAAFDTTGCKRMRDRSRGVVISPVTMASDVVACLEYRHKLLVDIVEVDR